MNNNKSIDRMAMEAKVKFHLEMFGLIKAGNILGIISDEKAERKLGKHFTAAVNTMAKYDPKMAEEGLKRVKNSIHEEQEA